jgi:hypothetical protein
MVLVKLNLVRSLLALGQHLKNSCSLLVQRAARGSLRVTGSSRIPVEEDERNTHDHQEQQHEEAEIHGRALAEESQGMSIERSGKTDLVASRSLAFPCSRRVSDCVVGWCCGSRTDCKRERTRKTTDIRTVHVRDASSAGVVALAQIARERENAQNH